MTRFYADAEIRDLIAERKPLGPEWRDALRLRTKRGHRERHLDVAGTRGNEFRLILRQSSINRLDFSLILAIRIPRSNRVFRLRRYNGKAHEHSNRIEGEKFYDFHIHTATERYQRRIGTREDAYAAPTDRYADYHEAMACLITDAKLDAPPETQRDLFEEP